MTTDAAQQVPREWILVAVRRRIDGFLTVAERHQLARASRLLRRTLLRVRAATGGLHSLRRWDLQLLARDLQETLNAAGGVSGRRRRGHRQRTHYGEEQLRPVARDLALVGLGIRPSCLVDACELAQETIPGLLTTITEGTHWRQLALEPIAAIVFLGNVFFVNVRLFLGLKILDLVQDLQHLTLVDASGHLPRAQRLPTNAPRCPFTASLRDLVSRLINAMARPLPWVLEVPDELPEGSSPTALAGLLLCYPVVYHTATPASNCLGMSPLWVTTTSITLPHGDTRWVLQEFSIPEHLVPTKMNDATNDIMDAWTTGIRNDLRQALGDADPRLVADVRVTRRCLGQVAL